MDSWDSRTELLLGRAATDRLAAAHVCVVGVGGVGGYAAEILARTGIGALTLIDADNVAESNLNRQIIATIPDLDRPKADLFATRFRNINPDIDVRAVRQFLNPDNVADLIGDSFSYVIDAIDTVAPKVALIAHCLSRKIPIISSMGAGGRVDPTRIGYYDLWETREDGLARAVRQRLKRIGLRRPLRVVASTEPPRAASVIDLDLPNKRSSYGTIASIPAIFGILLANHAVRKITGI